MRFPVKDTLTAEETEFGLRAVIRDGLASQTMVTLRGYLSGCLCLETRSFQYGNWVFGCHPSVSPVGSNSLYLFG